MTVSPPTDFAPADGYQPLSSNLLFSLSPMMVLALIVMLLLAGALGWMAARRRAPDDDPCDAIYDAIRKAVAAASGAPRDQVIASARKLQSVIDARLGAVLKLAGDFAQPYADLGLALKGQAPDDADDEDHGAHDAHDPKPTPGYVIHAQRDVVIHGVEPVAEGRPAPDAHGGGDHGASHHSSAPKGGHGAHTRAIDAATQIANVRTAVHALSDHWADKSARLAELRAARRQLTRTRERTA